MHNIVQCILYQYMAILLLTGDTLPNQYNMSLYYLMVTIIKPKLITHFHVKSGFRFNLKPRVINPKPNDLIGNPRFLVVKKKN